MQALLEEQLSRSHNLPGQLLYCYTRYQLSNDISFRERAEAALIELTARVVAKQVTDARTLRGLLLSGSYQDATIASSCRQALAVLDEFLVNHAAAFVKGYTLDGWYTAAVIARYFLLRNKPEYLEVLVNAWCETADPPTKPRVNPLLSYESHTSLGFEGISGLLILLVEIAPAVSNETFRKIIREGIRFLLSFRSEVDFSNRQYAVFPQAITSNQEVNGENRKLGWGGSDLAQALLFYRASGLFQDDQLRRTADLIGLNTLLRRGEEHLLTRNETVFGGAAGVAQTYATLYRLSGHQAYQEGYKHWLKEILISLDAQADEKYAGKEYDLYDGLLGIYLVLLSYQAEKTMNWSGALLLN